MELNVITVDEYLLEEKQVRQSHLDLKSECIERGGISTNHRGVLAEYLDTPIFGRPADLCHACHNDKCSNPRHLYWGTRKENVGDSIANGTHKGAWSTLVEKYGYEEACRRQARPGNKSGLGNIGKPKTELHKANISKAIKNKLLS